MLISPLYNRRPTGEPNSLKQAIDELKEQLPFIEELQAVSQHLAQTSTTIPRASAIPSAAIKTHCRYTRLEIMAALGESGVGRSSVPQQGVRFFKDKKLALLFVTLQKTEKQFSPTTRYRDYAISPSLFHWESQTATRETSELGQRYIQQKAQGWQMLLFVRETTTHTFLCCGPANYISHQGERPMAITWRLEHELPERFFEIAATAVA